MSDIKPSFTGEKDDKLGREMYYRQGKHVPNPNKEQSNDGQAAKQPRAEDTQRNGHISGSPNGDGGKEGTKPTTPSIQTVRPEYTRRGNSKLVPDSIRLHLNEHQHQAVALAVQSLEKHGGFLLADGTGAGKTRSQLGVAKYFADKGKKVLIISPAEVIKPNWEKGEAYGSFKNDATAMNLPVLLTRGTTDLKKGSINLTTYDNLENFKDKVDRDTILILDESHSIKNIASSRATHAKDLMDKSGAVMYATATPGDKPFHLSHLVRAHVFGKLGAARTYKKLGLKYSETGSGWIVDPKVGHVEVARRIAGLFNQMTKDGLMIKRELSLTNVKFGLDRLELSREQHAVIDQTYEDWFKKTGGNRAIALMMARLHQEPFKIPSTVKSTLEELKQGRSVLIFSGRINDMSNEAGQVVSEGTAKALKKQLIESGIKPELIGELHGGEKSADIRKSSIDDFQNGKKKILIATIQSGGTGVNLDDTTGKHPRSVVMMTPPFTANEVVQAIGRVNRLNTNSDVRINGILANTVIDDWNAGILEQKFRTLGAAVAGQAAKGSSLIGEDVPTEWRRPFEWGDSLLPSKPFESVKTLRAGEKKEKKGKKKKGFFRRLLKLLSSEYYEGKGSWLLEHKSGIYTDVKGHKYKLLDGKRVALNPKHQLKLHRNLKYFLGNKARKVKSSNVYAAKYDAKNQTLRVAYKSDKGSWYKYFGISPEEAESFWTADSKGAWLWDHIRVRGSKTEHQKIYEKEPPKYSVDNQELTIGNDTFNIRKLYDWAETNSKILNIDVKILAKEFKKGESDEEDDSPEFVERSEESESDLVYPILITRRSNGKLTILDGRHRYAKAVRNKRKYVQGYIIDPYKVPDAIEKKNKRSKKMKEALDTEDTTGMDTKIKDEVNTEDLERRENDFRAEQELEESNDDEVSEQYKALEMMARLNKIKDPIQRTWYQALFAVAFDDLGDWILALEKADADFEKNPNPPDDEIVPAEVEEAVDGSSFSNITGQLDFGADEEPKPKHMQEAESDTQKEVDSKAQSYDDTDKDTGHPDEVKKFDLLASIIGGAFGPHNAIKLLDGQNVKEAVGEHHQGIFTDVKGHKYKIEQGKRVPVGDERDKEVQQTQEKQSKQKQNQQPVDSPVDSKQKKFIEASKHTLAIQQGQLPADSSNFGKFADSAGKMTTTGLHKLKDAIMRNLPPEMIELVTEHKGAVKKALVRFAIAAGVVGVGAAAVAVGKTAGSKVGNAAGNKIGDKLLEIPGGVKKLMQAIAKRHLGMEEKQSKTNVPFPPPPPRGRWHSESVQPEDGNTDEKLRLIAKILVGLYGEDAAEFLEQRHKGNIREAYEGFLLETVAHKSGLFKDRRGHRYKLVDGKRVKIDANGKVISKKPEIKTNLKSAKPESEQANDIHKASVEIKDVLQAKHQRKGAAWKKYAIEAIAGTAVALLVLTVSQLRNLVTTFSLRSADLLQPVADKITNLLRQKQQQSYLEPIYDKSGKISGWWDSMNGKRVANATPDKKPAEPKQE